MCSLFPRRATLLLSIFLGLAFPARVQGQEGATPLLRGEVRVGDELLSEGVVVLHLVSEESSGEIDSVRVESDGSFKIRLPHVPDHANRPEIFFASVEYRGLLYFGPAVTEAVQLDSLYRIQAFDTLSVPFGGAQIPLSVRNLFLEKSEDGWTATDVFQLRNEGDRTLYSPEESVVWAYPLPAGATDFQVGQADMAPDAIRFQGGRIEVYSPLSPGERYLMIHYFIPGGDFVLPLPGTTDRMELLVREPAPSAEFPPLALLEPVEVEPGNAFRRYSAENLVDSEVRGLMAPEPWSLPAEWLGLVMAGLLGAAGIYGYRRRGTHAPAGSVSAEATSREGLLQAIAELDETFHAAGDGSSLARTAYETQRKTLLSTLKRLS